MVTSELTGEVSMGVLLVFLVSWRWGRYIGSDQQGDIFTIFSHNYLFMAVLQISKRSAPFKSGYHLFFVHWLLHKFRGLFIPIFNKRF
jgi:hypothetical protein